MITAFFGILIMAAAIEGGCAPSELWDFWIGFFKNLWKNAKYIIHMIHDNRKK